jgi:hypothetical protein
MNKKDSDIINEVDSWMEIDGVNSVALSERNGKTCILVTSSGNKEEIEKLIPDNYKGYKVYIDFSDDFFAL